MPIGLRKMVKPDTDNKLHTLIMGQTGNGKTHYGSTCPDPIGIGFDDRIYGVDGYTAININTLHQDTVKPKVLDRQMSVFLANNSEYIDKIPADLELHCNVSKLVVAFLRKKKMSLAALKKKYAF